MISDIRTGMSLVVAIEQIYVIRDGVLFKTPDLFGAAVDSNINRRRVGWRTCTRTTDSHRVWAAEILMDLMFERARAVFNLHFARARGMCGSREHPNQRSRFYPGGRHAKRAATQLTSCSLITRKDADARTRTESTCGPHACAPKWCMIWGERRGRV